VILGNHRDAWTFGAADPSSGMHCCDAIDAMVVAQLFIDANLGSSTLNEVARGLGAMHMTGWRPRRSIVLCSWDAEEFGLIGSTEYVERRRVELQVPLLR
jgi:N-acetylated-alpha-linked acidic dipeptidase